MSDAMMALNLHVAYEAIPTDRGGKTGPKGKAWSAFIEARDHALSQPVNDDIELKKALAGVCDWLQACLSHPGWWDVDQYEAASIELAHARKINGSHPVESERLREVEAHTLREAEAIWNDALWQFNPNWETDEGFEGSRDRAIKSIARALTLHDHVIALDLLVEPETRPVAVKVKPLEWGQQMALSSHNGFHAHYDSLIIRAAEMSFGTVRILRGSQGQYEVWVGNYQSSGAFDRFEGAYSAAQADYEARIRSALIEVNHE